MMKRDLKSAFRHVPVNHNDHWLLIFEWDGQFFVEMFFLLDYVPLPEFSTSSLKRYTGSSRRSTDGTSLITWTTFYLFPPKTDHTAPSSIFDQTLSPSG